MNKKYNTPMLTLVSIKHNDIVTGSPLGINVGTEYSGSVIYAPDRFNDWYEGE